MIKYLLPLTLLFAACRPEEPRSVVQPTVEPVPAGPSRFNLVRVDTFEDSFAYEDRRGVYILTDTLTGKEYVGVSGIGISELGSLANGKHRISDERQ